MAPINYSATLCPLADILLSVGRLSLRMMAICTTSTELFEVSFNESHAHYAQCIATDMLKNVVNGTLVPLKQLM